MNNCEIIPFESAKACSGKCLGGGKIGGNCSTGVQSSKVWVIAACNGMISLYEKGKDAHLEAIKFRDDYIISNLKGFSDALEEITSHKNNNQIIVVGSKNDISWIHTAIPKELERNIVAEIEYPLLPAWFKVVNLDELTKTLRSLVH